MKCLICQADNPDTKKFCRAREAKLLQIYPYLPIGVVKDGLRDEGYRI